MREITYCEALREALREEMRKDQSVFMIGEDVGRFGGWFTVSKGLLAEFGGARIKDTPISESAMIGLGVGAALTGLRPIVDIYFIDLVAVCMDPIVNLAAALGYVSEGRVKVPLVIRVTGGGTGQGHDHGKSLEAWFVHTAGLKVAMPSTPYDAKGLLKTAITGDDPVIFIEHKLLYFKKGPVPEEEYTIPFGEADIKKEGNQFTIVATSLMVREALKAAEELEKEGISAEVIDPRTLIPLDIQTIVSSVRKTSRLIVVHEACERGGIGAEIVRQVVDRAFDSLDVAPKVIGAKNIPLPYSKPLESAAIPSAKDIIRTVKELM